MTPEQIRAEIALKGRENVTMTSIAKGLGCSQAAVSLVVNKKSVSMRIMKTISEAIGKPTEIVFPEYFKKKQNL